ncbi:MAG: radical SAM protein [Acidobacteria bacterium]|jgi:wyosine [tRNA(Phe)-imidazoG37] synthetase (radical SAM superfamily)|nr:radical SAM protein [Acidobacteriota bacterium]
MAASARREFARETIALQQGVIYGPVMSRRLGRSLGLNLLPDEIKLCSLNCRYCQYGWTGMLAALEGKADGFFPSRGEVKEKLARTLAKMAAAKKPPDTITFSGNGEATLHPEFPGIVADVIELRDRYAPGCKTAILSNSTTIGRKSLREAILKLDEPILKLDAGTAGTFKKLNGPAPGVSFQRILDGLRLIGPRIIIQSLFVNGGVDNTSPDEVGAWVKAVVSVAPREVQIYTLDRGPADASLKPVPLKRLETIAAQLRKTGVKARVFA